MGSLSRARDTSARRPATNPQLGAPTTAVLGPRELLRNRTFLLWQSRSTLNIVGYTIYIGTLLWLTYSLSGGILLSGIVIAVQTAVFSLTFLISPLVDRLHDKRWAFVVCYPIQAGLAAVLGVAYALETLTVPVLLGIVVLLAVLWDFTEAADQTTTRLLFGKDGLFMVSGLGSAIGGGVDIAMYFAGGLAIAIFGVLGGVSLVAGLLAIATLLALPIRIPTPEVKAQSWWRGLKEGWRLFRGNNGRALRQLSLQQFVLGFFVGAPTLLMTLYVGRFFAESQSVYAALYVAYVVGGIIIGLILGHLNPRRYIGPVVVGSTFVMGFVLLGAEIAVASLIPSLLAWFVMGVANTTRNTSTWTYVQGRFDAQVLARVTMNIYLFTGISSAVGAFAVGALSTAWNSDMLTWFVSAGLVGAAALGFVLPETRRLSY
jgi:hypothetical protein